MDGVMYAFDTHFSKLSGTTWYYTDKLTKREKGAKWDVIRRAGTFYRDLPLMPGALEMWDYLQPYEPCILSAYSIRIPESYHQKIEACERDLPGITRDRIILVADAADKAQYCEPGDILLDDRKSNVDEWLAEGGHGILFKSMAQAMADLRRILD